MALKVTAVARRSHPIHYLAASRHIHKFSEAFIPIKHETPKEASVLSHKLLVRAGYIHQSSSGIYHLLPLALRSLRKLKDLIRQELGVFGAQELSLSTLTTKELWQQSDRWDTAGHELLRLVDRKNQEYCLAPTHEEAITTLVSDHITTYRQLPQYLYQLDRKYRDEPRPRFGLLRGREFWMKDLYTFDLDDVTANTTYDAVFEAYRRIFQRLEVPYVAVAADTGMIGGEQSHEFQILAPIGEDNLLLCQTCGRAANVEVQQEYQKGCPYHTDRQEWPSSKCQVTSHKGIEVGHTFLLGTKYSDQFNAVYTDSQGKQATMFMGCYGLGLTRILAAVTESLADENGLRWPLLIAPYRVMIVTLGGNRNPNIKAAAEQLYHELETLGLADDVMLDDRDLGLKTKLSTSRLLGIPFTVVVGNNYTARQLEVYDLHSEDSNGITTKDLVKLATPLAAAEQVVKALEHEDVIPLMSS